MTTDEIRNEIVATRSDLDEKLDILEERARRTFSLRYRVGAHPWKMFGAAVGAGFVLGFLLAARSHE